MIDRSTALDRARAFLTRAGLQPADDAGRWTPLTGGVSSDLWRVDLPDRTVCVKGALARLRVADVWFAPVDRNAVEHAWLEFAARHRPAGVPAVFAHDQDAGFFAMEFLEPADHPVWKAQLMRGEVEPAFAGSVGDLLGELHAASTREPGTAWRFATDANFEALRLDPYLRVTGRRHPAVAQRLEELATRTAGTHLALVHGDVSPKNILAGPHGPILLDAECAWFGDPAFDVAFCLTHLAVKMLVVPDVADALFGSGEALLAAHTARIDWEDPTRTAERAAALLPAILLARADGASPVDYLDDAGRQVLRDTALHLLAAPAPDPHDVLEEWRRQVTTRPGTPRPCQPAETTTS